MAENMESRICNSTVETLSLLASNCSKNMDTDPLMEISILWMICQGILAMSLLLDLWLFTAMLSIGKKNEKFVWPPNRKNTIFLLTLTAIICSLVRFICIQGVFFGQFSRTDPDSFCKVSLKVYGVFHVNTLFLTYLTLWFRQRLLHGKRMMKIIFPAGLKYLSQASLGILIICYIYDNVLYIVFSESEMGPAGCRGVRELPISRYLHAFQALITLFFQAILIFLFVFPLKKQIKRNEQRFFMNQSAVQNAVITRAVQLETVSSPRHCSSSISPAATSTDIADQVWIQSGDKETGRKFSQIISKAEELPSAIVNPGLRRKSVATGNKRKCLHDVARHSMHLALICVASDILMVAISLTLTYTLLDQIGIYVFLTIFYVNVSINVFCVFALPKEWKSIFLSPIKTIRNHMK